VLADQKYIVILTLERSEGEESPHFARAAAVLFVIPQPLCLSFRSEAKESAVARPTKVGCPIHRGFISDGWDTEKFAPSAVALAVVFAIALAVVFVVCLCLCLARAKGPFYTTLGRRPRVTFSKDTRAESPTYSFNELLQFKAIFLAKRLAKPIN
jgi:hypothetical protein